MILLWEMDWVELAVHWANESIKNLTYFGNYKKLSLSTSTSGTALQFCFVCVKPPCPRSAFQKDLSSHSVACSEPTLQRQPLLLWCGRKTRKILRGSKSWFWSHCRDPGKARGGLLGHRLCWFWVNILVQPQPITVPREVACAQG